ncbi:MBL fold metallo-hydrolase [Blautia sp. RD014234]|nr:MBL fold metallo-hydrolase [Blautia parvula]
MEKNTGKKVKTILYTHGHPDHRGGAGAFQESAEEIIAFEPVTAVLEKRNFCRIFRICGENGSLDILSQTRKPSLRESDRGRAWSTGNTGLLSHRPGFVSRSALSEKLTGYRSRWFVFRVRRKNSS